MAIRTAIMRLVNVDSNNKIIYKDKATIAQVMSNAAPQLRVFEFQNNSAPNAAKNNGNTAPTLHEYLVKEDDDSFELIHLDQTFVITKG